MNENKHSNWQPYKFIKILKYLSYGIVYYASRSSININYKLRKDFKLEHVNTLSLPISAVRKFDKINEEEILQKQFGPLIMEFVNVIIDNIPNTYLTLFFNNLNTLNSLTKDFDLDNLLLNQHVQGKYLANDNTIVLSKDNCCLTIDHELLHASTTIIDKSNSIILCGFQQINKGRQIGEGLNEGYTQYLAEKYFGDKHKLLHAYLYEKRVAEILEIIVGEDLMKALYFNANLMGLIEYLKQYNQEEEIYKFIRTLDFLNKHLEDKHLTESSFKIIFESLQYINIFLIKTSLRKKIVNNSLNEQMDVLDLIYSLIPILNLLPANITSGNYKYEIVDNKLINENILAVMSEYTNEKQKKSLIKEI